MPETTRIALPSDRDSSGRDLGDAEIALLTEAVRSGHLNSTGGTMVPRFEQAFAARFARAHAIACASGTAAIHAAVGALGLREGDEVITTPITDIGGVLPICYEGGVPVFADVDPETCNVTAATIAAKITDRTRAVIVTSLFGMPCAMAEIMVLADKHSLTVIEDCAQAFLAEDEGRMIGSFGHVACYSFQQGKHMTTGEGGMVITDDAALADGVTRYVNKGWGYGDAKPDHDRPGLNYRLTELQAAVGIAQLEKLDSNVNRRIAAADDLAARLASTPGLRTPQDAMRSGDRHVFWRYALRVDDSIIHGGPDALGAHLGELGVWNVPRYIKKPAFRCALFDKADRYPMIPAHGTDAAAFPGTDTALGGVLVLPWNEHYTTEHTAFIADSIIAAAGRCTAP